MIYKIDFEDNKSIEICIEGSRGTIEFQNCLLCSDSPLEGLSVFKKMLERALNDELEISLEIKNSSIGLWWNDYTHLYDDNEVKIEDLTEELWLWSTRYIQSWLFSKKGKVYLEISPSYPWHFVEAREGEEFISYQEFRSKFEPIAVIEILPEQAKSIIGNCSRLIEYI